MQGFGEHHKSKNQTNKTAKPSKDQIINQAFKFHSEGNISEAAKYYQYFINQGFKDHRVFSNYAVILKSLGNLKEAELLYRKAIEIKPDYAEAHSNLGIILRNIGKLQEAEISSRKAIEIKPDYADAYFNLFRHYEQINNLEKLKESLNEFNKIDSIKNELLLFSARLSFRNKEHQTAKELIDNISSKWIEKSNSSFLILSILLNSFSDSFNLSKLFICS